MPTKPRFAAALGALLAFAPVAVPAKSDDTLVVLGGSLNVTLVDTHDAVAEGAGFSASQHLNVVKQHRRVQRRERVGDRDHTLLAGAGWRRSDYTFTPIGGGPKPSWR